MSIFPSLLFWHDILLIFISSRKPALLPRSPLWTNWSRVSLLELTNWRTRRRIKERIRRKNSPDYLLSQIQQWSALGQTLYPALPRSL